MPDDQAYKPLDPGRVDILSSVELQYWSRELHCTEDDVTEAVAQVGSHVTAVRDYLASRR